MSLRSRRRPASPPASARRHKSPASVGALPGPPSNRPGSARKRDEYAYLPKGAPPLSDACHRIVRRLQGQEVSEQRAMFLRTYMALSEVKNHSAEEGLKRVSLTCERILSESGFDTLKETTDIPETFGSQDPTARIQLIVTAILAEEDRRIAAVKLQLESAEQRFQSLKDKGVLTQAAAAFEHKMVLKNELVEAVRLKIARIEKITAADAPVSFLGGMASIKSELHEVEKVCKKADSKVWSLEFKEQEGSKRLAAIDEEMDALRERMRQLQKDRVEATSLISGSEAKMDAAKQEQHANKEVAVMFKSLSDALEKRVNQHGDESEQIGVVIKSVVDSAKAQLAEVSEKAAQDRHTWLATGMPRR